MLFGEGDADDGDEEQCSEKEVHQAGPQASEDDPKDVCNVFNELQRIFNL